MKKTIYLAVLLLNGLVYSQVGVNTTSPKTTMDISIKRANTDGTGAIVDNSKNLGLLAPRLTRAELSANTATYGADQAGALIYITDVSGGDALGVRANITAIGYYYFDSGASQWKSIGGGTLAYQSMRGGVNYSTSTTATTIDTANTYVYIYNGSANGIAFTLSTTGLSTTDAGKIIWVRPLNTTESYNGNAGSGNALTVNGYTVNLGRARGFFWTGYEWLPLTA